MAPALAGQAFRFSLLNLLHNGHAHKGGKAQALFLGFLPGSTFNRLRDKKEDSGFVFPVGLWHGLRLFCVKLWAYYSLDKMFELPGYVIF
jgi:hypothetical protein